MRSILKNVIILTTFAFFIFLLISSLFIRADFGYTIYGDEPALVEQDSFMLVVFIIAGIIASVILFAIGKRLEKYNARVVIPCVLLVAFIMQLLIISSFRTNLTCDWEVTYGIAKSFNIGDYQSLDKGGYLYTYPHNLGVVLLTSVFTQFFTDNLFVPRVFNALIVLAIILISYFLLREITRDKAKHYGFLLLLASYLPPLFFSMIVYNDVISCFLLVLYIYAVVKIFKAQNIKIIWILLMFFALAMGNFLRNLGLLLVFAVLIYALINKVNFNKILVIFSISMLALLLPLVIFNQVFLNRGIIKEPLGENSAPILKWVHMGITFDHYGYWDNGESLRIYRETDYDKEASEKIYIAGIKSKLQEMGFRGAAEMYAKKLVWMWTEGTYQSIDYGMSYDSPGGYQEKTEISEYFLNNFESRYLLKNGLYIENLVAYFFIVILLVASLKENKKLKEELLLILIILIFSCFYLLWEVKPRYLFPIYPYILVLYYLGVKQVSNSQKLLALFAK